MQNQLCTHLSGSTLRGSKEGQRSRAEVQLYESVCWSTLRGCMERKSLGIKFRFVFLYVKGYRERKMICKINLVRLLNVALWEKVLRGRDGVLTSSCVGRAGQGRAGQGRAGYHWANCFGALSTANNNDLYHFPVSTCFTSASGLTAPSSPGLGLIFLVVTYECF